MLRILKAQRISNLADSIGRIQNTSFGKLNDFLLNKILRRPPRLLLEQIPEIIGRQAQFISEIMDGRQSLALSPAGFKIPIQQSIKTLQDIPVRLAPGSKLPLIKTHAILQKQVDMGNQQSPAMPEQPSVPPLKGEAPHSPRMKKKYNV